ncbi:MAG: phytanoyl-CoA dioxygenase family protein [Lentisphaeria bacterium]|nr:phytanoyl-CoA dioxygenase family protein [Lentisphaeria bacterium]NQZ69297.1 phytanoyl-CoA dioxygenase family protein [Lentisphaeria bacterium]
MLSEEQVASYRENGYIIESEVFTHEESDEFIDYMLKLKNGEIVIDGFSKREDDGRHRTMNQHFWDPRARSLLLDKRLGESIAQCFGEPGCGIQTMFFFEGSQQGRHQDNYYLPQCMSAWVAFEDVSLRNGTIGVQKGSHKGHMVSAKELDHPHGQDFSIGGRYSDAVIDVHEENARNGMEDVVVIAKKGDVVFFDGTTIHQGLPIEEPGSSRFVMANHYIRSSSIETWPYPDWPIYTFDGELIIEGEFDPEKSPNRYVEKST